MTLNADDIQEVPKTMFVGADQVELYWIKKLVGVASRSAGQPRRQVQFVCNWPASVPPCRAAKRALASSVAGM